MMLCQDCNKREAQVHLTQIVNNEKTTLHLCKKCAAARGFHSPLDNIPFPLAEMLSGMAAGTPQSGKAAEQDNIACGTCGLTFESFTQQGRFGCGDCYKTFRHRLEKIMRKIHGASLHRGRSPVFVPAEASGDVPIPVKEEERLEQELRKAIEAEEFERAAEIRDKLKTMKESLTLDKDP
jgi:protein arginine kinase activator